MNDKIFPAATLILCLACGPVITAEELTKEKRADIEQLMAFYKSPIGSNVITLMPALVQESMAIGQQWGQSLAPQIQRRVLERFKVKGVDLAV